MHKFCKTVRKHIFFFKERPGTKEHTKIEQIGQYAIDNKNYGPYCKRKNL